MKRLVLSLIIAVSLYAAQTAHAATMIDRVVAVVGQDVVTLSELQTEMATPLADINQRYRGEELARATEMLKKSTLANLIDKYLQLQEAKLQGVEVTGDEVDAAVKDIMTKNKMDMPAFTAALEGEGYTLDDYKKTLKDQLSIIRLVTRAVKSKIAIKEDDVQKYYAENISQFSASDSVKVANILFPAKDKDMDAALKNAKDARAQIAAGTPFEEMAAKCTGNPGAAKSCVLGTFKRGELSAIIEGKAFKMSEGEVSEPIAVDNGYQLIKVMEKTTANVKPLKDVRDKVVEELSARQGEELFAKWIQELRKRTYVEIRE